MKALSIILLTLMPILCVAQNYPDISKMSVGQIDMNKLFEMQTCMSKIDQKQLQDIQQLQKNFDTEISALCASGKRDQAQQKAISFAKQIMNHPAITEMKKCGEIAKDMLPDMPFMHPDKDGSTPHVCDAY